DTTSAHRDDGGARIDVLTAAGDPSPEGRGRVDRRAEGLRSVSDDAAARAAAVSLDPAQGRAAATEADVENDGAPRRDGLILRLIVDRRRRARSRGDGDGALFVLTAEILKKRPKQRRDFERRGVHGRPAAVRPLRLIR